MNANNEHDPKKPMTGMARNESPVDDMTRIPNYVRWLTNLTYIVGDVLDGMLIKSCYYVNIVGFDLKQSAKKRHRRLMQSLRLSRLEAKDFCREIYELEQAEKACDDSDFLFDMIVLIADRTGDDAERQEHVRKMLLDMPSYCKFYDIIK